MQEEEELRRFLVQDVICRLRRIALLFVNVDQASRDEFSRCLNCSNEDPHFAGFDHQDRLEWLKRSRPF